MKPKRFSTLNHMHVPVRNMSSAPFSAGTPRTYLRRDSRGAISARISQDGRSRQERSARPIRSGDIGGALPALCVLCAEELDRFALVQ
eukprot:4348594-Prymnesium_polylepis.2